MYVKYIYIGLLSVFCCSSYAMDEHQNGLVKDITSEFRLGFFDRIADLAFVDSRTLMFLTHVHSRAGCNMRFGKINIDDDRTHLKIYKEIPGVFSASKLTPEGNLLFGCKDGRVGFYIPNQYLGKIFSARASSEIINVHESIIDRYDEKTCKAITAISDDGNLHCIADDEKNFKSISLIDVLRKIDKRTDHKVIATDIKNYKLGILPFVAFAVGYSNLDGSQIQDKYTTSLLVYNPIKDEVVALDEHAKVIYDIRFLPDMTLCSASQDGTICLWDPQRKEKRYTVRCITEPVAPCSGVIRRNLSNDALTAVFCVKPSPCGRYIASIDASGNLRFWDVDTGAALHTADVEICVCDSLNTDIIFSPDGKLVCVFNSLSQKIYDVSYFVERKVEFSDEASKNGITTFIHKRGAVQSTSILDILRKRELGQKS